MAYYKIVNQVEGGWDYVAPYESYRDMLSSKPYTISVTVGDQTTADEILARNRAAYLEQERERFPVHRLEIWRTREYRTACDLDTEPPGEDMTYGIYNFMRNETIYVVGLPAALDYRNRIQNEFLAGIGLGGYETLTYIPLD
jgi:hypothetical protein